MNSKRILLNSGWKFALNPVGDPLAKDFDASQLRPVELPHDWQIEAARDPDMPGGESQGFYPREGIGYYVYEFAPKPDWRSKTVRVEFEGVQRFATVYLNGHEVGGHMYGYVPFEVNLNRYLKFDEPNTLIVKVDNSTDPQKTGAVISSAEAEAEIKRYAAEKGLDESRLLRDYDCAGDRWYSGAGIFRNVYMALDDDILYIKSRGLKIDADAATGDVRTQLSFVNRQASPTMAAISYNTYYPDGSLAYMNTIFTEIASGDAEVQFSFNLPSPQLWDVDAPNLYELIVIINMLNQEVDCTKSKFGFRDARFDADKGFMLNGRALKLYGADLHHDYGAFGAAVEPRAIERRLMALKSMGCNAIRCSHNPQCVEFYDACDRLGLLVIDELYDKWVGTGLYYQRLFMRDWQDDLTRMVTRDYNHPSIILWSMGNEVEIQYSEPFYAILADMCALCRKLDPARPVSAALIGFCLQDFNDFVPLEKRLAACVRYGQIVDVFMGNYMEGYYDSLRAAGLNKAFIGSEVFSYYRLEDNQTTNVKAVSPWRDVATKDFVAGGFVWAGVDYIGESLGWPCRGWTGCPIDSAGFLKLRAYHLMSQWSDKPMIKIGVFDEGEPWDMANRMWGFPQMSAHWNYECVGKLMHVAVMTNCDMVALYRNGDFKRVARSDAPDRMAHFYLDYQPGALRAVGIKDGKAVCEQTLKTSRRAERLELAVCEQNLRADGRDIVHIEAKLIDKFGQRYEQNRALVRFTVEGPADIIKVDNGDFLTTEEIFDASERTLNHGQALAILRSRPVAGHIRVTAAAQGFKPVCVELESR